MKTLRQYSALCTLCNGTGLYFGEECRICNGTGVNSIICESDPVLTEIFQIPEKNDKEQKRVVLFALDEIDQEAYDKLYGPISEPELQRGGSIGK